MVAPEEGTLGDSAREDFCTRIKLPSGDWAGVGLGEMKANVGRCTSWDPTGIHVGANLDNHAKVRPSSCSSMRGSCINWFLN